MYLIYKATCKSRKIRISGWYYSGSDMVSCKILEQSPTRCVELGDLSKMLSVTFLILSSEVLLRTKAKQQKYGRLGRSHKDLGEQQTDESSKVIGH